MKKLLTWLLLLSASLFFAHPVNADADTTANSEVFASIYRQGVSKNNWHIVHPFTFVGNFQGDFKASYLHQITSWK